MWRYILRRLAQAVLVIFGVLLLVFVIMQLTGDPASLMLPPDSPAEDIQRVRIMYGLDRPLYVQFVRFLFGDIGTREAGRTVRTFASGGGWLEVPVKPRGGVIRGDFGESLRYREQPALGVVLERFPRSLELMAAAFLYAVLLSLVFGLLCALRPATLLDQGIRVLAILGQSMPSFWLGLLLILVFAVWLGWLPAMGSGTWWHLVMPAITLGSLSLARNTRLVRSGMLDVLNEDYVRTARAKGLTERLVVAKHALKNTAIPLVTLWGLDVGVLFGGAVITESIFAWPGTGRLVIESVTRRDFPVVQAAVFFIALIFVLVNLVVDLVYGWLDPRVRVGR
ncbi:MAG: ABC transporter permease [Candidatus Rokubacteria bacterium]|nr:ABC transporter permease [Candidatus Rokubacteria bacterium]MBI3825146.1 ABC transporter permease [Candidatus Rokubacteria bacterium]